MMQWFIRMFSRSTLARLTRRTRLVPTLRVGMQTSPFRQALNKPGHTVFSEAGTEQVGQHRMHSHAERGNELSFLNHRGTEARRLLHGRGVKAALLGLLLLAGGSAGGYLYQRDYNP